MQLRGKTVVSLVTLGARIRSAREQANISQEELASRVSKDQRAVSDYENGKRKLAAAELPAFARALNVSVLYFFEGEISQNDVDRALLKEFHQIASTEAQQDVIEIVRLVSRISTSSIK